VGDIKTVFSRAWKDSTEGHMTSAEEKQGHGWREFFKKAQVGIPQMRKSV
jgi:hypothetical protein